MNFPSGIRTNEIPTLLMIDSGSCATAHPREIVHRMMVQVAFLINERIIFSVSLVQGDRTNGFDHFHF